ncbi:MAG TPA: hypothetical protein VK436_10860 [Methanocella sp.]|nr:hypothetical protein [Methanocella sp.]
MAEKCACGLNWADLIKGKTQEEMGIRKVICAKCGKEIYTDIKDKTMCFECEKNS